MNKRTISLGKRRGLAQCADQDGIFNILALDHRQAVKKGFVDSIDPHAEAVAFKRDVVRALAPVSSAFLLDPSIGAGPCLADSSLPGSCGLIVTLEASGYAGPGHARISRLPDDWSADQIKRLGASAVKLLVYYHHRSETASEMRSLVTQVQEDCERLDIALFLEILTYSPDSNGAKLTPEERVEAAVQAAADLSALGGDILKTEFPVDVKAQPDPDKWSDACRQLNNVSSIPWVLLSAGVDYPVFAQQVEVACKAGASGILAGRAIWKEALEGPQEKRKEFLQSTASNRMQELRLICQQFGRPYTEVLESEKLMENWYSSYGSSQREVKPEIVRP